MAQQVVDDVSSITLHRTNWTINVKVLRIWTSSKFEGAKLPFSMEMVLMDAKGDKIHASIRKSLIYKFNPVFAEDRVYSISQFDVVENGGPYQTTKHLCKINFKLSTDVVELTGVSISKSPFTFVPFSDILYKKIDANLLFDVIGVLTGVGTAVEWEKDNKQNKRNIIELDSDQMKLECVFFGKYVNELSRYLSSDDMTNAVVIIQFAKLRIYQGKPGIQNVYGATRIIFNPEIDEAVRMKQRFMESNDSASQGLSQLQDPSTLSVEDDFLSVSTHKTIQQIKDMKEYCSCVVLGTIKMIQPGGWWYPACKCSKKVEQDENMYFCDNCNRHVFSMFPKYRLALCVADENDIATFVVFDQEACNLLKKPCAELVDRPPKVVGSSAIPEEICDLVGKTFLFKIEVKNASSSRFEISYTVKKICSDDDIIYQFKTMNSISNDIVYTPSLCTPTSQNRIESSSSNLAKDLIEDFVIVGSTDPAAEVSNDSVVDLTKDTQGITPVKRSSPSDDKADGSTNVKLRMLAKIKQEKI